MCSRCYLTKSIEKFCRNCGNDPAREFKVCNRCSEQNKKKTLQARDRTTRKISTLETGKVACSDTSSVPSIPGNHGNLDDVEFLSEIVLRTDDGGDHSNDAFYGDFRGPYCDLDEVQSYVQRRFHDAETLGESTRLTFQIKLEPMLLVAVGVDHESLSKPNDPKVIRDKFKQVAKVLLVPFEAGSGYYWELRKLNLRSRNRTFSGCATAHVGCAQRDDRWRARPRQQPKRRRSESRPPVGRYPCMGVVTLTIDPQNHLVHVHCQHLRAHPHPKYRASEFPADAKQWIQDNKTYNLRTTEQYEKLCNLGYIDPQVHTKEQVYYWISEYSRESCALEPGQSNRLASTKAFIERPDVSEKGFKLLCYLENDFVQALGFATPLLKQIGISKINEVLIDSNLKTNQELFELFVVNANCGGCGFPIAYLYVTTLDGIKDARDDTDDIIKTRMEVLREFFTSLRQEGLLPTFLLLDRDSDQIFAANEAWSWTTNLQICYWHVERAIQKRLMEKTLEIDTYGPAEASKAHQVLNFIDPSWTSNENTGSFCHDDMVVKILNTVKRHAKMHPLIPVAKDTFWSSGEMYRVCVEEMYQLCRFHNLCSLWGYLWLNWYNCDDWKLFACSAHPSAIPLSRTSRANEIHWTVGLLKYICKYNYNRPRLDQLTRILVDQVVPEFQLWISRYDAGLAFPSWWEEFDKDWSKLAATAIQPGMDECYHIDVSSWVCSCPSFRLHPYFLCEHLIFHKHDKQFKPTYLKTTLRHDHPLVTFGVHDIPTLSPENNPWTKQPVVVVDETDVETEDLHSRDLGNESIEARLDKLEERRKKLVEYRKLVDAAFILYEKEIDNDRFAEEFDGMMLPIAKAVEECAIVLARKQ